MLGGFMSRKFTLIGIAIATLLGIQIMGLLSLLNENISNELAAEINLAGKQRMISQRIAFHVNHMLVDKGTHYDESLDDINEQLHLFVNNHKALSTAPGLSQGLNQIYFHSPYNLDKKVKSFAAIVKAIIQKTTAGELIDVNSTEVEKLNTAALDTLIGLLDVAVMQFQKDAEDKLSGIRSNIKALTQLIIFTLFISILAFSFMLRKLSQNGKRLSINQFVFDHSIDGIITANSHGTMLSVNPAVRDLLSCETGALMGKNLFILLNDIHAHKDYDIQQIQSEIERRGSWREEILSQQKGIKPLSIGVRAVYSASGEITHYVALMTDISVQKQSEDKYRFLSMHDALTGLLSRMALYETLEHELNVCERHDRSMALMMLDLDGFKQINDECGHQAGDEILKAISQRLKNAVRSSDLVARLGGDEFVVVQTEIEHHEDAEKLARKILEEVEQPVHWNGMQLNVGISIGIAIYPNHGATVDELLFAADAQMYKVKDNGKNNFSIYSSE
jgi:diguanylate cyclase (GGDEF)-like protein/PAS domain S-box-containing protein